ncbi:unnamed protein product [Cunninghamella echinulata]
MNEYDTGQHYMNTSKRRVHITLKDEEEHVVNNKGKNRITDTSNIIIMSSITPVEDISGDNDCTSQIYTIKLNPNGISRM